MTRRRSDFPAALVVPKLDAVPSRGKSRKQRLREGQRNATAALNAELAWYRTHYQRLDRAQRARKEAQLRNLALRAGAVAFLQRMLEQIGLSIGQR